MNTVLGALYTIPSLAMFAFLLSFVGIGFEPAVIALAVYCLQLIMRNTVVGLREVSAPVQEAARGMGLTKRQAAVQGGAAPGAARDLRRHPPGGGQHRGHRDDRRLHRRRRPRAS